MLASSRVDVQVAELLQQPEPEEPEEQEGEEDEAVAPRVEDMERPAVLVEAA